MSGGISAEEAVRKAREIAARLSGQVVDSSSAAPSSSMGAIATTNISGTTVAAAAAAAPHGGETTGTNSGSGSKRKRWGVMPAAAADNGNEPINKKLQIGTEPSPPAAAAVAPAATTKRLWVTKVTPERPAAHFVSFVSKGFSNIIADITGQNQGDASTEEEAEKEGEEDPTKLYIRFKGKGSSMTPPLPGMPEEPLHVWMYGKDAYVQQAESRIAGLLREAETAPIDTEAVQAQERALVAAGQLSLQQLQQKSYRPASVATMIGNASLPADKLAAALLQNAETAVEEEIHVPNGVIGYIIGRGGETIARLQAQTLCKIQIQKEHEMRPGQTERVLTLQSSAQEHVNDCKQRIQQMVNERVMRASGGGGGGGGGQQPSQALVEMEVPDADVGLVIGKMGATIKMIQDQTGANIQVPKTGNVDNPSVRTLRISHANEDGANRAKQMIMDILRSKPSFANENSNKGTASTATATTTLHIPIPDKDVGLCIGRQGCVIKHMQNTSNTRIQIPQVPNPGEMHRIATVSGTPEGCKMVEQMIQRIVQEQSSHSVLSGAPLQPQRQQPQQVVENQQYSAEWAAYHAAQQQAQQQQQQQQQAQMQQQQRNQQARTAQMTNEQQATSTTDTTYHEQFFRYAYYYGEEAARKHYGAWSPPPGTPNPYGVNPNGITPAPVAAPPAAAPTSAPAAATPAPAATTAPAPAAAPTLYPEQPRETSRRHVSNLPAWMTKK